MSGSSKPAIIDSGKAVGLSILIGAVMGFAALGSQPGEALAFSLLLLPLIPVPVAYLTARHGIMVGALSGLVIGTFCSVWTVTTGSSLGLLVFLLSTIVGIFAGYGFKTGVDLYRMVVLIAAMFLAVMLFWSGVYLFSVGLGPAEAVRDVTAGITDYGSGLYEQLGIEKASIEEIGSRVQERIPYMIPSILLVLAGVLSIATVALSRYAFRVLKEPFPGDIRFSELRLHYLFVYVFIIGMVAIFASSYTAGGSRVWIDAAGQNLVVVTEALFFVQALSIAAWFMRRNQASGIVKTAVYAILALLEWLFSLPSLVGIFDVFIDFRKRYGGKGEEKQGMNDTRGD